MIKAEQRNFQSLNIDASPITVKPTQMVDCRNFRITSVDNNSMLCLETEKGSKQIPINMSDSKSFGNVVDGIVLGHAEINEYVVLFSHTKYKDFIYRLKYDERSEEFDAVVLFAGDLNFDYDHPITTLPYYENDKIIKVYWVDGLNPYRAINIVQDSYIDSNTQFNAYVPVTGNNGSLSLSFEYGTGVFSAGVIQYVVTLSNAYMQESVPIFITPVHNILYSDTLGAEVNTVIHTIVKLHVILKGEALNFKYFNVYSVFRSSLNTTPTTKKVGMYEILLKKGYTSFVSDIYDDNSGDTVDPTDLLYLGGRLVCPEAIAAKDNVLFLGNLCLPENTNYKISDIAASYSINQVSKSYKGLDGNQASLSSRVAKRFKYLEYYRLGIRIKFKNGEYSMPIFINDEQCTVAPRRGESKTVFQSTIIFNEDFAANVDSVIPIIVYPDTTRTILCQGVVSPTVFNVGNRYKNAPFNQASWFFRAVAVDAPSSNPEYRHNYCIPGNLSPNAEIQCLHTPYLHPILTIKRTDYDTLTNNKDTAYDKLPDLSSDQYSKSIGNWTNPDDWVESHSEYFYVDQNIVTLNSPELEKDDTVLSSNLNGYKCRIVGIIPITSFSSGLEMSMTTPAHNLKNSVITAQGVFDLKYLGDGNRVRLVKNCWIDSMNFDNATGIQDNVYTGFAVYPWQSNAPLGGDDNITETTPGLMKSKVINNTRHSENTIYVDKDNIVTFPDSQSCSYFKSSEDTSAILMNRGESVVMYTGNTDELITPSTGLNTVFVEYDAENWTIKNRVYNKYGYPVVGLKVPDNQQYNNGYTNIWKSADFIAMNRYYSQDNEESRGYITNPVPLKYKSTPHAVICLGVETVNNTNWKQEYNVWTLPSFSGSYNKNKDSFNKPFWGKYFNYDYLSSIVSYEDTKQGNLVDPKTMAYTSPFGYLYLGELYQDLGEDVLFGGKDEYSLAADKWNIAGSTSYCKSYKESNVFTVTWEEGDTYFQRYDCLKTYPHTEGDYNSIIEVLSFWCETRINLDAQCSANQDNPNGFGYNYSNFLKINSVYQQPNNYYTYRYIPEYESNITSFPTTITWTKEKISGSITDNWLNVSMASTMDTDGTLGSIHAITLFSDKLLLFQNKGVSVIQYNEKSQLSTEDGTPVELGNSGKITGIKNLNSIYGTTSSLFVTQDKNRVYFYDPEIKEIITIDSGATRFSVSQGVQTWFNNTVLERISYNKKEDEVQFFGKSNGNKEYIAFSNVTNSFTSIYDCNHPSKSNEYNVLDFDLLGSHFFLGYRDFSPEYLRTMTGVYGGYKTELYKQHSGEYGNYLNNQYGSHATVLSSPDVSDKIFDNVEYRSSSYNINGEYLPNNSFTKIKAWTDYQEGENSLNQKKGFPSSLKRKFRVWRAQVPRSSSAKQGRIKDRIRNPWAYIQLSVDSSNNNNRMIVNDLIVYYNVNN